MKRILVPTDFSPNATKALDFAVQIARRLKGDIVLVHATETPDTATAIQVASGKLELLRKSIQESESIQVITDVVADSSVNLVLDAIPNYNIDLVVMGTVGNTGFREKVFGSRTAKVIAESPVPVLAIPLLSDWKTPGRILLAINKFEEAEKRINPVLELANVLRANIQVAIFTDTDDDYVEDYGEHEVKIAGFRDQLRAKYPDLDIQAVHLAGKHFLESLQNWIDKNDITMLVMLTHKRKLFENIFNPSRTQKMSYHTNVPMLAIPV